MNKYPVPSTVNHISILKMFSEIWSRTWRQNQNHPASRKSISAAKLTTCDKAMQSACNRTKLLKIMKNLAMVKIHYRPNGSSKPCHPLSWLLSPGWWIQGKERCVCVWVCALPRTGKKNTVAGTWGEDWERCNPALQPAPENSGSSENPENTLRTGQTWEAIARAGGGDFWWLNMQTTEL